MIDNILKKCKAFLKYLYILYIILQIIKYTGETLMIIADGWKDYEVIDTSGGEKLERWGDFMLIRPDPQVIWNTPKSNKFWKSPNAHYHRSAKVAEVGNSSIYLKAGQLIIKN